ncbi:hypothetical protein BH23GEM1_BH23GEM1_07660 [soil metagenome]
MSNRIVTGIASLMLAAFAVGCDENEGPVEAIQVRPLTTSPVSRGILEGATFTFTATGPNATPVDVTWESSNTAVATVNATTGRVTGVSAGVSAITARLTSDASVLSSSTATVIAVPALTSGVARTGLAGSTRGTTQYFKIVVPTGKTGLTVTLSGGTGDADMYIAFNTLPSTSTGNTATSCAAEESGNNEVCTFVNPPAGTWFIALVVWNNYTGASLTARVTP